MKKEQQFRFVLELLNSANLDDKSKPSQRLTYQLWCVASLTIPENNTIILPTLVDTFLIPTWDCFAFEHSLKVLNRASLYGTIHAKPIPNSCRLQQNICKGMLSFNVGTKQSHLCSQEHYLQRPKFEPTTKQSGCAYYYVSLTPNIIMSYISQSSTCIRSHILTPESISSHFPKKLKIKNVH